jgi:glycosyltransferase involved in cell wall biosynthesis
MSHMVFSRNLTILLLSDALFLALSCFCSIFVHYDFRISHDFWIIYLKVLPLVVTIKFAIFYFYKLYVGRWRYIYRSDFFKIIKAATLSTCVIAGLYFLLNRFLTLSWTFFLVDWCLTIFLISGFRLYVRLYFEIFQDILLQIQNWIVSILERLYFKKQILSVFLFMKRIFLFLKQILLLPKKALRFFKKKAIIYLKNDLKPLINWLNHYHTFFDAALDQKADAYHAHDLPLLLVGASITQKNNTPLIYDSHELWLERGGRSRRWYQLGAEVQRYMARHFVDASITVNESIAEELNKRYELPFPISLRNCSVWIDNHNKKNNIRERLKLSEDAFIALFHGSFGRLRGLDNLVKTARYLRNENIFIVLLGRGSQEEYLKNLTSELQVEDIVKFLPFVPEAEVLDWVCSADVGLVIYPVSSLNTYLSSPNKIFQYLMASLPIITVNHPEKKKLVIENDVGITGCVLDEPDPRLIAKELKMLSGNKKLRKEMAENARFLCRQELNWENESKKLIQLYSDLFASS